MFNLLNQLNFLAILVTAVVAQVIAIIWYLPPIFGLRWATLINGYPKQVIREIERFRD